MISVGVALTKKVRYNIAERKTKKNVYEFSTRIFFCHEKSEYKLIWSSHLIVHTAIYV